MILKRISLAFSAKGWKKRIATYTVTDTGKCYTRIDNRRYKKEIIDVIGSNIDSPVTYDAYIFTFRDDHDIIFEDLRERIFHNVSKLIAGVEILKPVLFEKLPKEHHTENYDQFLRDEM